MQVASQKAVSADPPDSSAADKLEANLGDNVPQQPNKKVTLHCLVLCLLKLSSSVSL